MATLTVLGDRVMIQPIVEDTDKTKSGIILVEKKTEPILKGKCMSGEHVNKIVYYPAFTFYEVDGVHIVKSEDILAFE